MNPTSNESAGLQLPVPEQVPDIMPGSETAVGGSATAEQASGVAEKVPAPRQGAPATALAPITLPLPPTTPQDTSQTDVPAAAPTTATPAIVDDGDLIEKEWVHKAKQIVEANRDDPYKQSEELTVFKADYMKKRYDKNIKLSE